MRVYDGVDMTWIANGVEYRYYCFECAGEREAAKFIPMLWIQCSHCGHLRLCKAYKKE